MTLSKIHCLNDKPASISQRVYSGMVYALLIELTAAQCMLEEEHNPIGFENDTNIYILGRIGKRDVVIACLPAGVMGTNSAALVATQMKFSFPTFDSIS